MKKVSLSIPDAIYHRVRYLARLRKVSTGEVLKRVLDRSNSREVLRDLERETLGQ